MGHKERIPFSNNIIIITSLALISLTNVPAVHCGTSTFTSVPQSLKPVALKDVKPDLEYYLYYPMVIHNGSIVLTVPLIFKASDLRDFNPALTHHNREKRQIGLNVVDGLLGGALGGATGGLAGGTVGSIYGGLGSFIGGGIGAGVGAAIGAGFSGGGPGAFVGAGAGGVTLGSVGGLLLGATGSAVLGLLGGALGGGLGSIG